MNRHADPAPIDDDDGLDQLSDAELTDFVAAYHEQLLGGRPAESDGALSSRDVEPSGQWQAVKRVLEALARARQEVSEVRPEITLDAKHFSWADFTQSPGDSGEPVVLTRLGRFTIERELGRGGLSVVYLAHDPVLRRKVALKVPRPEALLTPEARSRFQREAQAAARLTHPSLVAVYEVGEAGPIAYIASALCTGPNLAEWLLQASEKLGFRRAAEIVLRLAEAIDYAHGEGVLHRDIKPSNVLLDPKPAPEGGEAFPYVPRLGDFGLARVDDLGSDATRTGLVLGTPGYMSPEQAEGRPEAIGPMTDVYGLGAVLYELLVGAAPCGGSSHAEANRRAVFEEPRRPRKFRPEIPRDLEAICLKCLEKRPDRRYPSARDLVADLGRFLAGEPTHARPLRAWHRTGRWALRRPAVAGLLGLSLVAAIASAAFGVLYTRTLQQSLRREHQLVQDLEARDESMRRLATPVALRESHYLMRQGSYAQALSLLNQYPPPSSEASEHFAWRYLQRLVERRPMMLTGHRGDVYSVVFSPDEATIASAGQDGTVRFWNARDGHPLAKLEGHQNEVNSIAYSPDGAWLYSVDDDGHVRLWDTRKRTSRGIVAHLPGRGWGLVVAGPTLWCLGNVHTSTKNSIHLWTIDSDGSLIDPETFEGVVGLLAAIDTEHVLGLDGETQQVMRYGRDGEHSVEGPSLRGAMALDADRTHHRVAFGFDAGGLGYLHGPTWRLDKFWDAHRARIETGAFLGDELLATGAGDGLVSIWGADPSAPIDTLPAAPGRLWALESTRDGQRLAVAGTSGYLAIWELDEHRAAGRQWSQRFDSRSPTAAKLSPDGSRLAVAQLGGEMVVFESTSGAELVRFPSGANLVRRLVIADDNQFLALLSIGHEAQVWDLAVSPPRLTFRAELDAPDNPGSPGEGIAFRPGGASLLVGPLNQHIQEIETATGRVLREINLPSQPLNRFLLNKHDAGIAVTTLAGGVEIVQDGIFVTPTAELPLRNASLVKPSPAGDLLIVVQENTVALWRFPEMSLQTTIALEGRVRTVAMSPQGDLIAACMSEGTIRVVDCRVREEVLSLPGFPFGDVAMTFSPDGSRLTCAAWIPHQLYVRSWRCQ